MATQEEFKPCNCLKETEAKILEKLKTDHPSYKILEEESGYVNKALMLGDGRFHLYHEYKYRYTFQKTNGTISTPKSTTASIYLNFCGFCGKPLTDPKDG